MSVMLSVGAVGAVAADSTILTQSEAKFLSLLDYGNAVRLGRYLAEDIGNRIRFSPRRDLAADWLMAEFESYGYEPYIQEFTYTNTPTNNGLLWINGKHYAYYGPTWASNSIYRYNSSVDRAITGAAVLNWPSSSQALVVPSGNNYTGKAVFVTLNGTSAPSAANYYNASLALQNAGAAAVMFQTYPMAANGNTQYSRIGSTVSGTAITIPVGTTLNYETSGIISSLGDGTALTVNMYASTLCKNVIAKLPSSTGSKKTVYITSHYDTTESGPGMNDNGSGVLMMLEMARAFKNWNFEYNLVFISFDSEESGLRGAYNFCEGMTNEERSNFVANYNMDMIATSQANCIHFFLNISDSRLLTLQNQLSNTQRLINVSQALNIAKEYDIFNHSYLAAQKVGFDMTKFNICHDNTTDHYAFVVEATRAGNNFPNLRNAVEYDWRSNEKGTGFETLYHKAGDTYALNFSPAKLETAANVIALAINLSARGFDNISIDDSYLISMDVSLDDDYFAADYNIYNEGADGELIVVAALYDSRGKMVGLVMESVNVAEGALQSGTVSIAVPPGYDPDDLVMKAFVWDGITWCPVACDVTY